MPCPAFKCTFHFIWSAWNGKSEREIVNSHSGRETLSYEHIHSFVGQLKHMRIKFIHSIFFMRHTITSFLQSYDACISIHMQEYKFH